MRIRKRILNFLELQDPKQEQTIDPVMEARQTEFSYVIIYVLLMVLFGIWLDNLALA